MKIFLSIAVVFITLTSFAQDDVSISHYQKKWSTDTVHLPCEKWDSRDLLIPIPDSVYNSGTVSVKKLRYKGVKRFGYKVTLKDGKSDVIVITCKGKKQVAMLLDLDFHISNKYKGNKNCDIVSFMNASHRRGRLKIALNPLTKSEEK